MRTLLAVTLGALFFVGASAVGPGREIGRAGAAPGQVAVTVSSATFVDATRGTPARVGSPARASRTIHELIYNPVGDPGPLPTVMFAPGWDSQSAVYDPLLRAIASAGFLVVGVDSPGSSSYFPGAPWWSVAGEDIANNTLDLSAALTNLESGPFAPRIDRAAVAAVGHSNGGSEVANLALNRAYNSSRFNAYVVLSGVLPFGQVTGSFGPLNNGPMLMAVGTADEYGNYSPGGAGTEAVYGAARSSKIMVTIQGASHLSAFVGSGPQADDTRAAIANFLNVAERHDPGARASFDAEVKMDGLSSTAVLDPGWYAGPAVVVFTRRPGLARDIAIGGGREPVDRLYVDRRHQPGSRRLRPSTGGTAIPGRGSTVAPSLSASMPRASPGLPTRPTRSGPDAAALGYGDPVLPLTSPSGQTGPPGSSAPIRCPAATPSTVGTAPVGHANRAGPSPSASTPPATPG